MEEPESSHKQPLETTNYIGETGREVKTIELENKNVGNIKAAESELFLQSPSVAELPTEGISSANKDYEASDIANLAGGEMPKDENLMEEKAINQYSDDVAAKEVSWEDNLVGFDENKSKGLINNEKEGVVTDENDNYDFHDQNVNILEVHPGQRIQTMIHNHDLTENSDMSMGKSRENCSIEVAEEINLSTHTESSEGSLRESNCKSGADKEPELSFSSEIGNIDPEATKPSEEIQEQNTEKKDVLKGNENVCIPTETASIVDEQNEEAIDNGQITTVSTALTNESIEDTSEEKMLPDEGGENDKSFGKKDLICTEDKTQNHPETCQHEMNSEIRLKLSGDEAGKQDERAREIVMTHSNTSTISDDDEVPESTEAATREYEDDEGVPSVKGEINNISEAQDTTETSKKQEQHLEQSIFPENEPREPVERCLDVAVVKIPETTSTHHAESITYSEEQRPTESLDSKPEEENKLTTGDADTIKDNIISEKKQNLSTDDLTEKIEFAEGESHFRGASKTYKIDAPVKEIKPLGCGKQNQVLRTEPDGHVFEANRILTEEEKLVNETYEASKNIETIKPEHKFNEGEQKLDEACQLNVEEKLQTKYAYEDIQVQQEDGSFTELKSIEEKCYDYGKDFIKDVAPILSNTTCSKEKVDQPSPEEDIRQEEAEPNGRAESFETDDDILNVTNQVYASGSVAEKDEVNENHEGNTDTNSPVQQMKPTSEGTINYCGEDKAEMEGEPEITVDDVGHRDQVVNRIQDQDFSETIGEECFVEDDMVHGIVNGAGDGNQKLEEVDTEMENIATSAGKETKEEKNHGRQAESDTKGNKECDCTEVMKETDIQSAAETSNQDLNSSAVEKSNVEEKLKQYERNVAELNEQDKSSNTNEETSTKQSNEDLVKNSSKLFEKEAQEETQEKSDTNVTGIAEEKLFIENEQEKEAQEKILEKADTNATGVTEEKITFETEHEKKLQLDTPALASEKGLVITGLCETGSKHSDIKVELEEVSNLSENKDMHISSTILDDSVEQEHELQNETHNTYPTREDERKIVTGEKTLDSTTERTVDVCSEMNTEGRSIGLEEPDAPIDIKAITNCSEIEELDTPDDVKLPKNVLDIPDDVKLQKNTLGTEKSGEQNPDYYGNDEACNTDKENIDLEHDGSAEASKSSLMEFTEIEEAVDDVETGENSQKTENSTKEDIKPTMEEDVELQEQLRSQYQSDNALPDNCEKEHNTEHSDETKTNQNLQKRKLDMNEEVEPKLEAEHQMSRIHDQIETLKDVILVEEVHGVGLAEETESIKENFTREENCTIELQTQSVAGGTINEIKESDLATSANPEATNLGENNKTVLNATEDVNWESEACTVVIPPEEETNECIKKQINVTSSSLEASGMIFREENIDEADNSKTKMETAVVATMTERTSMDETLVNESPEDSNAKITKEEPCFHKENSRKHEVSRSEHEFLAKEDTNSDKATEEESIAPQKAKESEHEESASNREFTERSFDSSDLREEIPEGRKDAAMPNQEPQGEAVKGEYHERTLIEEHEDESRENDETIVNESPEDSNATNTTEETCLHKENSRTHEVSRSENELIGKEEDSSPDEAPEKDSITPQKAKPSVPEESVSNTEFTERSYGGNNLREEMTPEVPDDEGMPYQEPQGETITREDYESTPVEKPEDESRKNDEKLVNKSPEDSNATNTTEETWLHKENSRKHEVSRSENELIDKEEDPIPDEAREKDSIAPQKAKPSVSEQSVSNTEFTERSYGGNNLREETTPEVPNDEGMPYQEPQGETITGEDHEGTPVEEPEDESRKNDEKLVNESPEDSNAIDATEETCLHKKNSRKHEVSKTENELIGKEEDSSPDEAPEKDSIAPQKAKPSVPEESVSNTEFTERSYGGNNLREETTPEVPNDEGTPYQEPQGETITGEDHEGTPVEEPEDESRKNDEKLVNESPKDSNATDATKETCLHKENSRKHEVSRSENELIDKEEDSSPDEVPEKDSIAPQKAKSSVPEESVSNTEFTERSYGSTNLREETTPAVPNDEDMPYQERQGETITGEDHEGTPVEEPKDESKKNNEKLVNESPEDSNATNTIEETCLHKDNSRKQEFVGNKEDTSPDEATEEERIAPQKVKASGTEESGCNTEFIERYFDSTDVREETTPEAPKDEAMSNQEPQSEIITGKETFPDETEKDLVRNFPESHVYQEETKEEVLEDFELTVKGITEETNIKQIDKDIKLFNSEDVASETTGPQDNGSGDVYFKTNLAAASEMGENKDLHNPKTINNDVYGAGEKTEQEQENKFPNELQITDKRKSFTEETLLGDIAKEDLIISSAQVSEALEIVTTEASQMENSTSENVIAPYNDIALEADTRKEELQPREEKPVDPRGESDTVSRAMEKSNVNEETYDKDNDQIVAPELNSEGKFTESKEKTVNSTNSTDLVDFCKNGERETLNSDKLQEPEVDNTCGDGKPAIDASVCVDKFNTDANNAVGEQENTAENSKNSLTEDAETEKAVVEVKEGDLSSKIEGSETASTSIISEEKFESADSVAENQSKPLLKTSFKDHESESTEEIPGQDFQENQIEKTEEVDITLSDEKQMNKVQDQAEMMKDVILTDEVPERFQKADESNTIEEENFKEASFLTELHMASTLSETDNKIKDSEPLPTVNLEESDFSAVTEIINSHAAEDLNKDSEVTSNMKQPEEETKACTKWPMSITNSELEVSGETTEEAKSREAYESIDMTKEAPVTLLSGEQSLEEGYLFELSVSASDTTSDNKDLGEKTVDTTPHAPLPQTEQADTNKESAIIENPDREFEVVETEASEVVSYPQEQRTKDILEPLESLAMTRIGNDEPEEESSEVSKDTSKPKHQGTREVIAGDVIADQTLFTGDPIDQLLEPFSSMTMTNEEQDNEPRMPENIEGKGLDNDETLVNETSSDSFATIIKDGTYLQNNKSTELEVSRSEIEENKQNQGPHAAKEEERTILEEIRTIRSEHDGSRCENAIKSNENAKNKISSEKTTEKEIDIDSPEVSQDEETTSKNNKDDEVKMIDCYGEITHQKNEIMKSPKLIEELSEELERDAASADTTEDHHYNSADNITLPMNPPQIAREGKNAQEAIINVDLQMNYAGDDRTERDIEEKVNSSKVDLINNSEDRFVAGNRDIVSKNCEVENSDKEIPPVIDVVAEETPHEEVEEVSEPAPKDLSREVVEMCSVNIEKENANDSENLVEDTKSGSLPFESAMDKKCIPKVQEASETRSSFMSFPSDRLQDEIEDEEDRNIWNAKQKDFISEDQARDEKEEMCIKDEDEHKNDELATDLLTKEGRMKLDQAETGSTVTANEDEEIKDLKETLNVPSHANDSEKEVTQQICSEDVTKSSEISQELEKDPLAIQDPEILTDADSNKSITDKAQLKSGSSLGAESKAEGVDWQEEERTDKEWKDTTEKTLSTDLEKISLQDILKGSSKGAFKVAANLTEERGLPEHKEGLQSGKAETTESDESKWDQQEKRTDEEGKDITESLTSTGLAETSPPDILQGSSEAEPQLAEDLVEGRGLPEDKEDSQADKTDAAEVDEPKTHEGEGGENKAVDSSFDAQVIVDASKDTDVKVSPHKKSHGILSGVGSKVKHSIAKVKKVITGKSSHPKPSSPQ